MLVNNSTINNEGRQVLQYIFDSTTPEVVWPYVSGFFFDKDSGMWFCVFSIFNEEYLFGRKNTPVRYEFAGKRCFSIGTAVKVATGFCKRPHFYTKGKS